MTTVNSLAFIWKTVDLVYDFNFRELNDMVHTHHQQLVLWESDRLKVILGLIPIFNTKNSELKLGKGK